MTILQAGNSWDGIPYVRFLLQKKFLPENGHFPGLGFFGVENGYFPGGIRRGKWPFSRLEFAMENGHFPGWGLPSRRFTFPGQIPPWKMAIFRAENGHFPCMRF